MANDESVYDFNDLEARAKRLIDEGRYRDARSIYLFMADGDPSLDGGYLASRIGMCCAMENDLHSARYWYGRAVEENPAIEAYRGERSRLEHLTIASLVNGDGDKTHEKIVRRVPVRHAVDDEVTGLIDLISIELELDDTENSVRARLVAVAREIERTGNADGAKVLSDLNDRLGRIERILSKD